MKNPITKLSVFGQEFEGGIKFKIVHNLPENDFVSLFKVWYSSDLEFSQESLIAFVKKHRLGKMCISKADYDKITKGKVVHATKEEYEAENN